MTSIYMRPTAAPGRGRKWTFPGLVLVGAILACTPLGASECRDTYHVVGTVIDAAGSPVKNTRVRILLDKVSKRQYMRHGIRAVAAETDGRGAFGSKIVCSTGDPGPCARKPRHVTVLVNAGLDRTKLRTFRLRDLDVTPESGGCRVTIPPIKMGL